MQIYDGDKILDYKKRVSDFLKDEASGFAVDGKSFGDVIDGLLANATAAQRKKIMPTKGMQEFIDSNPDLFKAARNYQFETLRKLYVDKDSLLDDKKDNAGDEGKVSSKRDTLIKHLFRIQACVDLYSRGQHNEFLRKTEMKVLRASDKQRIKAIIDQLVGMGESTIGEVIDFADANGLCIKDDRLEGFIRTKEYIYDRVRSVKYRELQELHTYLEGRSLFSTQHKVKGGEIDNVLVSLDNGGWSNYNFNHLFSDEGKETVRDRSRKIFYVCCTRAKENLAVYCHEPSQAGLERIKEWFGTKNVIRI